MLRHPSRHRSTPPPHPRPWGCSDSADHHAQVRAALFLAVHRPGAAQGCTGILVDGGPYMGSGWPDLGLRVTMTFFEISRRLHSHSLEGNLFIVAQFLAFRLLGSVLCRLVLPPEQEVPRDHPVQMCRYGGTTSQYGCWMLLYGRIRSSFS